MEEKNINEIEVKEEKKKKIKQRPNLTVCGMLGFSLSLLAFIFVCLSFVFFYLSIGAFIASILSLATGSVGVHLSKTRKKEGKDYSNFAIGLGVISLIVSIFLFSFYLSTVF